MNDKSKSLLRLMFDPGERVCVSNNKFGHASLDLDSVFSDQIVLVSPNPDTPPKLVHTDSLIFVALNPMMEGFRRDNNCSKFRNFLVEIDDYDRDLQIGYIKKLAMPYSAMVWSGGKSTHILMALSEAVSFKQYKVIYKWILNIAALSDQQLGDPSRSIRLPGAIRPETGNEQELIELKDRITIKELFDWLNKYEHLRPKPKEKRKVIEGNADFSRLSGWARAMLTKGVVFKNKGRNQTWFGLAYDMALAGFSEENAIEILSQRFTEEHDFKEKEFLITISSAFKKVHEG